MSSPSILFLHSSDQPFGSDRVLLATVDAALAEDMAVRVLLPDDEPEGWLSRRLAARGVEVRKVPLAPSRRRYLRPRRLLPYLASMVRALRTIRAETSSNPTELVHINTSELVAAAAVRRRPGRRVIWHVHELIVSPRPVAWFFRVLPMWVADEVVANSEAVAANLARAPFPRARLRCVHNGVPTRPARADRGREDPGLCVYAGRLNRWKGYDLFVEAAGAVARRHPDARFVVAGLPPTGEEWRMDVLRARIIELGIHDRTDVIGLCEDVPALFDRADIVVVPSRSPEPFGLVTVEAMRSGCAVIATNHGASPEIITHGVDGVLITPNDLPALSDALDSLLSNPTRRRQLGDAGVRRVADAFSEERFKAGMLDLWRGASPRPVTDSWRSRSQRSGS